MTFMKNDITEALGKPDRAYPAVTTCHFGEHNFVHKWCNKITKKFVVQDSNPLQFVVVQSIYCRHRGCGARMQKEWDLDTEEASICVE